MNVLHFRGDPEDQRRNAVKSLEAQLKELHEAQGYQCLWCAISLWRPNSAQLHAAETNLYTYFEKEKVQLLTIVLSDFQS